MKSDLLMRALTFARRRRYSEAIKLLEHDDSHYYNSFLYYYLLAQCHLYSGVYGVAFQYFENARKIKMRDPQALLGMAALYLNHGDTDRAVDLYLEILDIDEKNPIAKRALKIVRKYPGPQNISSWIERGKLYRLFPPLPKPPAQPVKIALIIISACVILGLAGRILIRTGIVNLPFAEENKRRDLSGVILAKEDREAPMQTEGSFNYVLTREKVTENYNEARRLFASYHDEPARVHLNRILESNSPEPVKNKARLLLSYMETPGFDTLKDRFSYAEVIKEPVLYRNCHVIWRGMAGNVVREQARTSFDFLVGYDTRRNLEGIVRVDFDFAIPVNPERPVEILGRLIPISTEKGIDIRIQGIALNQAGVPENRQESKN
jgi:tetratricopeptide (TPR) repeat protein